MSRIFPIYVVDAFAEEAFAGNPAAVCVLQEPISDEFKQKIAAEMNLSETAFVLPLDGTSCETAQRFSLQWFTPTTEVPLCGHATLASSAVLFFHVGNQNQTMVFETRFSGCLSTSRLIGEADSASDGSIEMQLPLNPPTASITSEDEAIWQLVQEVLKGLLLPQMVIGEVVEEVKLSHATKKLLICLSDRISRTDLEALPVQPPRLLEFPTQDRVRGVIVTMTGTPGGKYDFLSRYFAPWVGIPEDPVTGSAHTVLAPYWAEKLGKRNLFARQCSKRGGELRLNVKEDSLGISGRAKIVLKGSLCI
eukprot:maker-scaffold71_size417697-snap-gene-2.12 protein:Tk11802 transcript:maker-scaffold71_size417697-snap-gene-2.12-mRNA-1 annotation:"phenazine biosynthesis-like domain-containing"